MIKKGLFLSAFSYVLVKKKTYCSPEPPLSMILRGQYENKIRRFSPPEKIFGVFATMYEKGQLLMSLNDLLKAICFYNYSISDQTNVENYQPKELIKFLGKNQKFQLYDYFLLARFLVYNSEKLSEYMKTNNLDELNEVQFQQLLKKEICGDYLEYIKKGIFIQPRQFKPSQKNFQKHIQQISKNLFVGREYISQKDINLTRKKLMSEIYQFQFKMFPQEDHNIDGTDFSRSIVKYMEHSKAKKYMKRIKKMKELQNVKVDIGAYKAFHMYMWQNYHRIEEIIQLKGALSTQQLTNLIESYVNKKGQVKHEQIEAIVKVLDCDQSGFLQKDQLLGVMKNLQYYSSVKSGEVTLYESLKKDYESVWRKMKKIKEIIQE